MFNWSLNGVNQLAKQWFWYRVGSTGPEQSIDTLNLKAAILSDGNGNGQNDQFIVQYRDSLNSFDIQVQYSLTGNSTVTGSHSGIGELISITNLSRTAALDIILFQYSDFDLGTSADDDNVKVNVPATYPTDKIASVTQSESPGLTLHEALVTQAADRYELGVLSDTLDKLNDTDADNLAFVNGNSPTQAPISDSDVTWAFQWVFSIAGDTNCSIDNDDIPVNCGSVSITELKTLDVTDIPEPTALALFGVGVLGLGLIRCRQRG